jgi:2-polyprenyl-3-methyl-5-hydroxy-6-metoxy-1,4-benzoquinol methylase
MKKRILISIIKLLLIINNFSYNAISKYVVKLENGNHPKFRLMQYHNFFLDNINNGDIVLDVGCGKGFNTFHVSKKAKKVIGIDIDEKNIKFAKDNYSSKNIEYINDDVLNHTFEEVFDVVVLSNLLEHLKDRVNFLISLKSITNKILIRVPLLNRSWIDLYKKELGIEYRLDKTHYIEYTFDEFKDELKKA